jgi:hypothetical protein
MANVKSQIAGLIPTTKDDIWKQVILLQNLSEFFIMFTFFVCYNFLFQTEYYLWFHTMHSFLN